MCDVQLKLTTQSNCVSSSLIMHACMLSWLVHLRSFV
uniref:Uncharacterized protein n=1 Tax=Arundo donax TaxID=35708 RepID=A0A0A9C2B6_ARUDO